MIETIKESRLSGVFGLIISLIGLLSRPEILGLFPVEYSDIITASGILVQAITKRIALYEK